MIDANIRLRRIRWLPGVALTVVFTAIAQQPQDDFLVHAITGTTTQKSSVQIDPQRNTIEAWRREDTADLIRYRDEPCSHSRNPSQSAEKPSYTFSCSMHAQSPLRGTRYVSHYVAGDCIKGTVAYQLYLCTEGCKGSSAPRTLKQEYWGCAESRLASTEAKQKLLQRAIAKPINQKMVKELERDLMNSCVGSENPSDLTADQLKYGQKANLALLSPAYLLAMSLRTKYGVIVTGRMLSTIATAPKNGSLRKIGIVSPDPDKIGLHASYENFQYTPRTGFHGEDRVSFNVDIGGTRFHVSYRIAVTDSVQYACEN